MKKILSATLFAVTALFWTGTHAQVTAIDVVVRAESADQGIQFQALIFAGGVLAGVLSAEGLHAEEKKPLVICLPSNVLLSPQQLVGMVKAAIEKQPEAKNQEFRLVAVRALRNQYPCK